MHVSLCSFVSALTFSASEALANVEEEMSNSDDSEMLAAYRLNTNCQDADNRQQDTRAGGGSKVYTPEVTVWTNEFLPHSTSQSNKCFNTHQSIYPSIQYCLINSQKANFYQKC